MIPGYWRGLRVVRLVLQLLLLESGIVRRVSLCPVHHGVVGRPRRRESYVSWCVSQLKRLHLYCLIQKSRFDAQQWKVIKREGGDDEAVMKFRRRRRTEAASRCMCGVRLAEGTASTKYERVQDTADCEGRWPQGSGLSHTPNRV